MADKPELYVDITADGVRYSELARPSQFHRNSVRLQCGHTFLTFGNLENANGLLFCSECAKAVQS